MSDENKFFHDKDRERILNAKFAKQREELRKHEISEIAGLVGASEELAEKIYQMGFDSEAVRILHLIPVIQVAWADGSVQASEREKIVELAAKRGISSEYGGPGYAFLEMILESNPGPMFFDEINGVIEALLKESGEDAGDLLQNCRMIAEASAGFLGLQKYSKEELAVIGEFENRFNASKGSKE